MIKRIILVSALLLCFCSFSSFAKAQAPIPAQETIVSYITNIKVNTDNSINVTENITYNTGSQEHHGIYRDLYPYSSQKKKMAIDSITVTDENGNPYLFQISNVGGNVRIKIGDPNQTFVGQKTYVIKYRATKAVAQLKDIDEIYWNVTGNDWGMPISQARAEVILPTGTKMVQSACYYGPKGSTDKCPIATVSDNNAYFFNAPPVLNPHEGLTIAVGFPKGTTAPYSFYDNIYNFLPWIIAIFLPLVTFIFSFMYWRKNGRDPKGTGVIVPQYDVPEKLTPMEVSGIVNEAVKPSDISAELIYLATLGYISIRQDDTEIIGPFKATDYELTRLKDPSDLPNDFDKKLVNSLFSSRPQLSPSAILNLIFKNESLAVNQESNELLKQVKLSDLKFVFYKETESIINLALASFTTKGYYKNLGRMKGIGAIALIAALFTAFQIGLFTIVLSVFIFNENIIQIIIGVALSVTIYLIFRHISPAKTEKGVALKEYLLGLKDYLQIAEKDRLQFHNAPEKKPEVFEKLLPYAMAMGVLDIWAKEFDGILAAPPSWYSGPVTNGFNAVAFGHSLNSFSTFASSSMTSSPSSGGSGGGGSSGGGGGGGGGGSW